MGFLDKFKKSGKPANDQDKKKTGEEKKAKLDQAAGLKLKEKDETLKEKKESKETKAIDKKKEDTKDAYRVLIRPVITEKATELSAVNKYVFEVASDTNKIMVTKAIEHVYGVKPVSVRMIVMRGNAIRYGHSLGKTKYWKKAIVTLKPEDKIEIYEGV